MAIPVHAIIKFISKLAVYFLFSFALTVSFQKHCRRSRLLSPLTKPCNNQKPAFDLLLFAFSKTMAGIWAFLRRVKLYKPSKPAFDLSAFFLISTKNFEKAASCFPRSNPAFSQAYVLCCQPFFLRQKLASQQSASAFSETILFSAMCLRRRL